MRPGQSRARAEAILELLPSLGQGWGGNFGKLGEAKDGEDYCRSLVRGKEVCSEREREGSCAGREETRMILWVERGRQGGEDMLEL